ncbi:MAG: hypothetical protein II596_06435 [Thermoguttaceae bacterium]|nr:hypothetical protein [Thermoguttaceae bacterium]
MKRFLLAALAAFTFAATGWGAEPTRTPSGEIEGALPAAEVAPNATVFEWQVDSDATLSGFYIRLTNCLPPRETPIVASLQINGKRLEETVAIPAFGFPLAYHTRPYGFDPQTFPPLDVAREFRRAVAPIALRKGDVVRAAIDSCGDGVASGVTCGLQFQGRKPLELARAPFRECRTNGPVCSIPWSEPEIVAVGTHKQFDPMCAPQNNSSVIADKDGTVYIFCAYYSVDEQYGGGRSGSYSRIYGYKKAPNADKWESMGLIVDLLEGGTYSGDPFVFRDLEGRPNLLFTSCDGTNGFIDWQKEGNYIIRSKTDSFAGPWGEPKPLWEAYPREPDDNKTGGRANCLRIYPRAKTRDYLVVWNHGAQDMDIRGLVVPNLDDVISHDAIGSAPVFVKNQEEGGGGFTYGDKGYYSTWQIPWLNDPNGLQRMYEVDLNDPLNPESWRATPGSIGFNSGANPKRDGGTTADAWAISAAAGKLWATSCEYSASENKNYLYVRSAPLEAFHDYLEGKRTDAVFRYGAVRVPRYHETFPTVEYALGQDCSFEMDFLSRGELSYAFIALGPSDAPNELRTVFYEVNPNGAYLVAYKNEHERIILAENPNATWEPNRKYRLKLTREGNWLVAYLDGKKVLETTVDDPEILANLNDNPRFRLYGWQGGDYEISNAFIVDGKER